MTDLTIRPTAKFIMMRAIFCALVFLAVEIAWYTQWRDRESLKFVPIVAPLVLIWPLPGALRRQAHDSALQAAGCSCGSEHYAANARRGQPVDGDLGRSQPADD